jgi:hypothetical protein
VLWTPELESEEACAERGYQTLAWLMRRQARPLAGEGSAFV